LWRQHLVFVTSLCSRFVSGDQDVLVWKNLACFRVEDIGMLEEDTLLWAMREFFRKVTGALLINFVLSFQQRFLR